jgi:hypothetical protein
MSQRLKVRDLDGAIIGATTATKLAAGMAGVSLKATDDDTVAAATHWWTGAGFERRTALPAATIWVDAGVATGISLPADAYSILTAGAPVKGPRTVTLAGGEEAVVLLTGKYAGTVTAQGRTLAQLEATLLDQIDDRRETLMMTVMTPGGAKKTEYAEKAGEVRDYRNTLGSVIASLSLVSQRARFPWAMAETDQTKETLAVVIARFEAGATASRTPAARYAAIAQVAKRAIKAATTPAAKRAAFDAVKWTA